MTATTYKSTSNDPETSSYYSRVLIQRGAVLIQRGAFQYILWCVLLLLPHMRIMYISSGMGQDDQVG